MKKTVSLLLAALLLLSLLGGCAKPQTEKPAEVTFRVVLEDGSVKEHTLSTEYETLSDALAAAGVISKEEAAAGYVLTVDGVTTDYAANESWWMLLDGEGNESMKGIADVRTAEADGYSFNYKIGF